MASGDSGIPWVDEGSFQHEITLATPMTEEELYAVERWVEAVEVAKMRNRPTKPGKQVRRNGTVDIALRHISALTEEVRRLQQRLDQLDYEY